MSNRFIGMHPFNQANSQRHKKKHESQKLASITLNYKSIYSYLAVVAGLCAEADYIFIPEDPPTREWPQRLCKQLSQASKHMEFYQHNFLFLLSPTEFFLP